MLLEHEERFLDYDRRITVLEKAKNALAVLRIVGGYVALAVGSAGIVILLLRDFYSGDLNVTALGGLLGLLGYYAVNEGRGGRIGREDGE